MCSGQIFDVSPSSCHVTSDLEELGSQEELMSVRMYIRPE